MKQRLIRVLCVDDHSFLVEGLSARFELEPDVECVGSIPSAEHLVQEAKRLRPDIVLLDIEMPGPDPFEAADELRRQCPEVRTVFLSAYVRDHYISAAVRAGAWGYFSKSEDADALVKGLRSVAEGKFAFSPKVQERCQPKDGIKRSQPVPPSSKLEALTPREQEVLRMIGKGMSRSDIAETICRSPKTVDGHRESIMEKLGIHDRAELVRFAIREGLVEV
ncbi:MAG: response regulator [Planctomycetota bacterium]|jgi:two-component system response regulator NreC